MKAALFGGSFNPIHLGHLALVNWILDSLEYDTIILIPTSQPPHKDHSNLISGIQRLDMVSLAVAGLPHVIVSDCEILRDRPSFTIDTVKYLLKSYPIEGKLGLVIGDDWINGFSRWKNVDELVTLALPIIAKRGEGKGSFPYPCIYLDNKIVPVSSTEIREKCKRGEDISSFVTPEVADYIERHGLYRNH